MQDWIARLAEMPFLQGSLVTGAAVVGEDAATVASGLLVAGGQMAWTTAFLGLWAGILLGDWGLYALGRILGPRVRAWGLVTDERLDRAERWFANRGIFVVILARCVPGLRLPTFLAAGVLQLRPSLYLGTTLVLSFAWTMLLLYGVTSLGEALLPYVKHVQWLFLGTVVLLVVNALVLRRARKRARTSPA